MVLLTCLPISLAWGRLLPARCAPVAPHLYHSVLATQVIRMYCCYVPLCSWLATHTQPHVSSTTTTPPPSTSLFFFELSTAVAQATAAAQAHAAAAVAHAAAAALGAATALAQAAAATAMGQPRVAICVHPLLLELRCEQELLLARRERHRVLPVWLGAVLSQPVPL